MPVDEAVRGRPAPGLREYVAGYDGYRQRGVAPARHRGLPSPFLTVIFTLDEPLHLSQHVDPRQPASSHEALIGGLHTCPVVVTHEGAQSGIQLRMSPLAARTVLGLPAGELARIDLDADQLLGSLAGQTRDRLHAAASWHQRFEVIDQMLQGRLSERRSPPAEVTHAWRRLVAARGRIAVSRLAAEVGWSERFLARRFHVEIGLGPKAAARVIRFDRARRSIQDRAMGTETLAGIAAACGYSDQSHLAREFASMAGCSPTQWLKDEFGNVQAAGDAAAPD